MNRVNEIYEAEVAIRMAAWVSMKGRGEREGDALTSNSRASMLLA